MTGLQYPRKQLDYEIARRLRFPPESVKYGGRWEAVTVPELRAELAHTPPDHPEYAWRRWELALAERQATVSPGQPFCRVVGDNETDRAAIAN